MLIIWIVIFTLASKKTVQEVSEEQQGQQVSLNHLQTPNITTQMYISLHLKVKLLLVAQSIKTFQDMIIVVNEKTELYNFNDSAWHETANYPYGEGRAFRRLNTEFKSV